MPEQLPTLPTEQRTCVNCGAEVTTNFCGKCRQRSDVPRLTFRTLIADYFERIFGLDSKLPRTIIDLTIRPGTVISSYLDGNRTRHVGPVSYYFWVFTFYVLLLALLGTDMGEIMSTEGVKFEVTSQDSETVVKAQQFLAEEVLRVFYKYIQLFTLVMFPILTAFQMAFFLKKGYNFLEHMVLAFYASAQPYLANMVMAVFFAITGWHDYFVLMLVSVVFYIWAGIHWLRPKPGWWGGVRLFLAYSISLILYSLVFGIGILVALFAFGPELK